MNRNGCLSIPQSIIISNTSAPAPTLTGDTAFCDGEELLLNAYSPLPNLSWYAINNSGTTTTGSTKGGSTKGGAH